MRLLEECDDNLDYKEMDDQLESMRRKKQDKEPAKVREFRKEYVDNTKLNYEYKAQLYYTMIKKQLDTNSEVSLEWQKAIEELILI